MIIRSLRQHFPARKTEWLNSGFLICWGVYVMLHPELFTDPNSAKLWSGMLAVAEYTGIYPALFWGGGAFIVGMLRSVALFINGSWTRTPLIRLIASFGSMLIISQIIIGFYHSGLSNTGLVVYPWLVVADLLSAYQAGCDVVHAEKQRELIKESRRADARTLSRLAA